MEELTMDDYISIYKKRNNLDDEWEAEMRKKVKDYQEEQKKYEEANKGRTHADNDPSIHGYDGADLIENRTATIIYIVVMVGSLIFKSFLAVWVLATFIYIRFLLRHNDK